MSIITGSQLKKIRQEQHIPLEQVAKSTRIRLGILRELEDDEYANLGSVTQVRGFLKIYAEYLGTPLETEEQPNISLTSSTTTILEKVDGEIEVSDPNIAENTSVPSTSQFNVNVPEINNQNSQTNELRKTSNSQKLLLDIGRDLVIRRKYLNIPWGTIIEQTHIPQIHIQALERGDLDAFANPMQAKGILQNYADFLNLDVESLLIRFADALQERRNETNQKKRNSPSKIKLIPPFLLSLKKLFTLDLLFGTLMVVGIVLFLAWGLIRMIEQPSDSEKSTELPGVMEVLIGTQTVEVQSVTTTPEITNQANLIPTLTPIFFPVEENAAMQLIVHVTQTVWVRINVDGDEAFSGRMLSGSANAYSADEYIVVEAGNAAALDLIFNQEQLDAIGKMGESIFLRFSESGMEVIPSLDILTPVVNP